MVKVTFTRKFHKGNLAGLTQDDIIEFVDFQSAVRWVRGIKANYKNLDYTLLDYFIN